MFQRFESQNSTPINRDLISEILFQSEKLNYINISCLESNSAAHYQYGNYSAEKNVMLVQYRIFILL